MPGVALTEDLRDRVTRKGTLDALLEPGDDGVDGAASFDVIVAPYVLDATTAEPAVALGTLHGLVAPTGVILVAVRRAGSLASRFDAVRGRSALPDAAVAAARHSWSWPMATPRRLVDPKSLRASARRAGLRMVECEDVIDTTGVVEVNALPVGQWVSARLAHSAKALFPTLRDTMVSTLVPLTVGRADAALGSDITKLPTVTVVVDSRDTARTARA